MELIYIILLLLIPVWLILRKKKNQQNIDEDFFGKDYKKKASARKKLDTYYVFMGEIIESEKNNNFDNMLLNIDKTIFILHEFIDDNIDAYESFDLGSIPAISAACRYWPVFGFKEKLLKLQGVIKGKNELHKWKDSVDTAISDLDLSSNIIEFIENNQGCLQNKMGKNLGVSGRDTARLIKTLEKVSKIRREKSNKTYKIFTV